MKSWYAIFVETNQEEAVQQELNQRFDASVLRAVVPKRRVPEKRGGIVYHVAKNMFPGYVLVHSQLTDDIYYQLKNVPGIYRVVHNGKHFNKDDCKIYPPEIEPIIRLLGNGDTLEYSAVCLINSRAFVTSGPLKGFEEIIRKIDPRKNRAKISLNFLGKEKLIDVGIKILNNCNALPLKPNM